MVLFDAIGTIPLVDQSWITGNESIGKDIGITLHAIEITPNFALFGRYHEKPVPVSF